MDLTLRPARHAVAVTPSDTVDLTAPATKGLYVGVSGAVKVKLMSGQDATFTAVPVGFFPVSVKRVFATGTTATTMLALS